MPSTMRVDDKLPQLRFLLCSRATDEVTEEEALALYEANRQWVEPAKMTPHERRSFDDLAARVGRGVFPR